MKRLFRTGTFKLPAFCVVLCVALFFNSCSNAIVIKDPAGLAVVNTGDDFIINLPENHSKGNLWTLKEDSLKDEVNFLNAVWHGNEKGIYFHFKAVKNGMSKITFFERHFADTTSVKSFIVKIVSD